MSVLETISSVDKNGYYMALSKITGEVIENRYTLTIFDYDMAQTTGAIIDYGDKDFPGKLETLTQIFLELKQLECDYETISNRLFDLAAVHDIFCDKC